VSTCFTSAHVTASTALALQWFLQTKKIRPALLIVDKFNFRGYVF
jgi:hypothetical protein